jgi:hypothetical protein
MLIITSRYGTTRIFQKLTDNIIEFQALDTLYYTGTGDNFNDLDAIDPDGGPYIGKGQKISIDTEDFIVEKFTNIIFDEEREYLQALLHVKKVNN